MGKYIDVKRFTYRLRVAAWGLWLLVFVVACDDGDIPERSIQVENSGRTVRLRGRVVGTDAWEDGYNVALAAFADGNRYAVLQRVVPRTMGEEAIAEVVLSNLSAEVSTVELAVTNRLRERIITLLELRLADYANGGDTIDMEVGVVRADLFGCIQKGIFDKACIQCHGSNGHPAAGLDLTEGNSYASLVGCPSARIEDAVRVAPGRKEESLLRRILWPGGESILRYNHTEVLTSQFKDNLEEVRTLIDKWIEGL